jgi:hypothetical protein
LNIRLPLARAALLAALATTACGEGEPSLDPALADATATGEAPSSEASALALQGCTALPVTAVGAIGHDGNVPANTQDDDLATRWSHLGKGSWIQYDLGAARSLSGAAIAWHQGAARTNAFSLSVSADGATFTPVFTGRSSGTTTAAETYRFTARTARFLRVTVDGNSLNDWASIAEARPCAGPTLLWRGDFETGDLSQWSKSQAVSSNRLQLVGAPLRQGRYALKATVYQGDDPINASGDRAELVRMTREPSGSEYAYRWSTMFAQDFPSVRTWQLFTQWHHEGSSGSPPVEFYVYGEELRLSVGGNSPVIVWRAPLTRGVWNDFVFRVRWSADPAVGFVELYHNGKLVLPRRSIATQFPGQLNYLKVGLYRNDTIQPAGTVFHDGWVMGRTVEDVLFAP